MATCVTLAFHTCGMPYLWHTMPYRSTQGFSSFEFRLLPGRVCHTFTAHRMLCYGYIGRANVLHEPFRSSIDSRECTTLLEYGLQVSARVRVRVHVHLCSIVHRTPCTYPSVSGHRHHHDGVHILYTFRTSTSLSYPRVH